MEFLKTMGITSLIIIPITLIIGIRSIGLIAISVIIFSFANFLFFDVYELHKVSEWSKYKSDHDIDPKGPHGY